AVVLVLRRWWCFRHCGWDSPRIVADPKHELRNQEALLRGLSLGGISQQFSAEVASEQAFCRHRVLVSKHMFDRHEARLHRWDQLRPLTRFAAPETEEYWSKEAPARTVSFLYREARRHERVRSKEAEEAARFRYLSLIWNEERTELYLEGMLPGEQGAALERSIVQRAEQVVVADDPADPS